ncbi:hypothetical protein SNEBB_006092, partial [Seison nebaliae]
ARVPIIFDCNDEQHELDNQPIIDYKNEDDDLMDDLNDKTIPGKLLYDSIKIAEIQEWRKRTGRGFSSAKQRYLKMDLAKLPITSSCKIISKNTFQEFQNLRSKNMPVHDETLRKIAVEQANKLGISKQNFMASAGWNKKTETEKNNITKTIREFQEKIVEMSKNYSIIMNTDEGGLNYDIVGNRTLSQKGEKCTSAICSAKNHLTHSYTVNPVINSAGKLLPKMCGRS